MRANRNQTSTNVGRQQPPVTSPSAAKQALQAKGITLRQFANSHGFNYRTVSEVVRGVNKGLYGEGHRVAVALGLKGAA